MALRPRNQRVWHLLAAVALMLSALPALALTPEAGPDVRVDFRTVLLEPGPREGSLQVTAFFAFRVSKSSAGRPVHLYLPIDGELLSLKAQAMPICTFDRLFTHDSDFEGAFYERVRAEQLSWRAIFTNFCANGSLPALLMVAPRWSWKGRGITAVVQSESVQGVHSFRDVTVLQGEESLKALPADLQEETGSFMRRSSSRTLVSISVAPSLSSQVEMLQPAESGVRLTYEVILPKTASTRLMDLPILGGSLSGPTLTRVYARPARGSRVEVRLPEEIALNDHPQWLVNRAWGSFEPTHAEAAGIRRNPMANVMSVRTLDGRQTTRLVLVFADWQERLQIAIVSAPMTWLESGRAWAGWALLTLLWPAAIGVYVLVLWFGAEICLWLVSLPQAAHFGRKLLLSTILSPFLTPWFMMRYLSRHGQPAETQDQGGAFGVLSTPTYDCLARLVVWAFLICVNGVIMLTIAGVGLWLRFD